MSFTPIRFLKLDFDSTMENMKSIRAYSDKYKRFYDFFILNIAEIKEHLKLN